MYIVHYPKEGEKQVWTIDKERLSIGRSSRADIVVGDPRISRIHAYIIQDGEKCIFVDANSTNGCFINGIRVNRRIINAGDIIRCGDTELHVVEIEENTNFSWDDTSLIVKSQFPLDLMQKRLDDISKNYIEAQEKETDAAGTDADENISPLTMKSFLARLKILYQIFGKVSSELNYRQLYTLIVHGVFDLLPHAQNVCLLLEDEQKKNYRPVLMRNRENKTPKSVRISKTAFQLAISSKTTLLAADAPNDPLFQQTDTVQELHLQSILCAPLAMDNSVIGMIYVDNREEKGSFDEIDAEFLTGFANHAAIAIQHAKTYDTLQQAYHQSILALQNVIETRDPMTMGHTYRTAHLAIGIAREMGLSEEQCQRIKTAAELHDIGKIAIDVNIIHKPGDLSYPEYLSVQEHVKASEKILSPIEYLHDVLPIIREHHENFDGSGYPDGLEGEQILLESRILSVADAFDAMISERSYKQGMSIEESLALCTRESGKKFDPNVVLALKEFINNNQTWIQNMLLNPTETV